MQPKNELAVVSKSGGATGTVCTCNPKADPGVQAVSPQVTK